MTLLSLGASGLREMLKQRKDNAAWFQEQFRDAATQHGLQLLRCPANKISFAVDITPLVGTREIHQLTFIGSALFTHRVSGPRVVLCAPVQVQTDTETSGKDEPILKVKGRHQQTINGYTFENFGAHSNVYERCYLTAACAIGVERVELEYFLARLHTTLKDFKIKTEKHTD